jgi:hypothetical protein
MNAFGKNEVYIPNARDRTERSRAVNAAAAFLWTRPGREGTPLAIGQDIRGRNDSTHLGGQQTNVTVKMAAIRSAEMKARGMTGHSVIIPGRTLQGGESCYGIHLIPDPL